MQVINMIGSRLGTAQTSMIEVCKSIVKRTPSKPMKKPRANIIPFLDLKKIHVVTTERIMKPMIARGEVKNNNTCLIISDFSSYLNCQASIRIPAVTAKILALIMKKQRINWVEGLPRMSGF